MATNFNFDSKTSSEKTGRIVDKVASMINIEKMNSLLGKGVKTAT